MANIELMNGDYTAQRLFVHETLKQLSNQYMTLTKDRTGKREDPSLPNDRLDCTLYAWRHCRNYWYKEKLPEPEPGTDAYWKQIEERQIAKLVAESHKESNWWDELT